MKVLFTLPNIAQFYLQKKIKKLLFIFTIPHSFIYLVLPQTWPHSFCLFSSLYFFYHQWILPSFFTWFIDLQIFLVRFGLLYWAPPHTYTALGICSKTGLSGLRRFNISPCIVPNHAYTAITCLFFPPIQVPQLNQTRSRTFAAYIGKRQRLALKGGLRVTN